MPTFLSLPIQVEALVLDDLLQVAGPLHDFSHLPWGQSATHHDSPYLSDTITAKPFEDQHDLQKGLHLHWSLPYALTKTTSIGLVYKQSFLSIFGTTKPSEEESSGEDIWKTLVEDWNWLKLIDNQTGIAKTKLPKNADVISKLNKHLPQYAQAIYKLLKTSVFPPTPNRWLVKRIESKQEEDDQTQKIQPLSQIVESDYLWPKGKFEIENEEPMGDYFTVYPMITEDPNEQPYRYMGRSYKLDDKPDALEGEEHLDVPLTAVGYGATNFAAFYPSCRSVFGHFDKEIDSEEKAGKINYKVLGWYDNPEHDYFKLFVDHFTDQWKADHEEEGHTGEGKHKKHKQKNYLYLDLLDALRRELHLTIAITIPDNELKEIKPDDLSDKDPTDAWEYLKTHLWIDDEGQLQAKAYDMKTYIKGKYHGETENIRHILNQAIQSQLPTRLVCYAYHDGKRNTNVVPKLDEKNVKLAIGNSPLEAASALLASEISTDKKSIIEDQLEAIQFSTTLKQTVVDNGPIFEALRHQKQFRQFKSGIRWRIKSRKEPSKKADEVAEDQELTLPISLANDLNQLNRLEEDKYLNRAKIDSLRRQIYADWAWYLQKACQIIEIEVLEEGWGDQDSGILGSDPDSGKPGFDIRYFDNQDQGDYGNQDTEDFGIAPTHSSAQPEDADQKHLKENLADLKDYLNHQMDDELTDLLNKEKDLRDDCRKDWQEVQEELQHFQDDSQLIRSDDINDWKALEESLSEDENFKKKGDDDKEEDEIDDWTDHPAVIEILNEKIQAEKKLELPHKAEESTELKDLKNKLDKVDDNEALKKSLLLRINRLSLETISPKGIRHRPFLELVSRPAARFWRPNDPALLISGVDASALYQSVRDTTEGTIEKTDKELFEDNALNQEALKALLENLRKSISSKPAPNDWRPLMLDWDVLFGQAKMKEDNTYGKDYLKDQFTLGNTDFAFSGDPGDDTFDKPVSFYKRSLLTPGTNKGMRSTLVGRLVPILYKRFVKDQEAEKEKEDQKTDVAGFEAWLKKIDPDIKKWPADDPDQKDEQEIKAWLTEELLAPDHIDQDNPDKDTDQILIKHLYNYLNPGSPDPIIEQYLTKESDPDIPDNLEGNIDHFLDWCMERTHIKADYVSKHQDDFPWPLDIAVQDDADLRKKFIDALKKEYLGDSVDRFFKKRDVADDKQDEYLSKHYNEAISWYQPQVEEALHLVVEIRAYFAIIQIRGLSQVMSGFSEALLMRKQAYQLPVDDPNSTGRDEAFTAKVRKAVQTANSISPAEEFPFSPVRAGKWDQGRLSLVDTFGRSWPPKDDDHTKMAQFDLIGADTLLPTGADDGSVGLPPRIAQAGRLDFRWLAALKEIEEMNDHPASNPICGWVVPNHLEDSLMIYNAAGDALGYIDEGAHWRSFPGNSGPIIPDDISNPHLAQMVKWIVARGIEFVRDFLTSLDLAHENMEPEQFSQHEDLALLLGQPFALVRADVSIQLQEPYALNQDYDYLLDRVKRFKDPDYVKDSDKHQHFKFDEVKVPIRIGEYHRLDDGLAGYWLEDENGHYREDKFYALQTSPLEKKNDHIVTRHEVHSDDEEEAQFLMYLPLNASGPQKVSMLIDPRAPIHATSGILPIKKVYVPSDQYARALQKLQIAFLTAPILSPSLGVEISLPKEPGYAWDWIQLEQGHWSVLNPEGKIRRHQFQPFFGAQAGFVWSSLVQAGWLTTLDKDTALIVPNNKRPKEPLPASLIQKKEGIELLLDRLRIRPFNSLPDLSMPHQLKEGWLRLKPNS